MEALKKYSVNELMAAITQREKQRERDRIFVIRCVDFVVVADMAWKRAVKIDIMLPQMVSEFARQVIVLKCESNTAPHLIIVDIVMAGDIRGIDIPIHE